MAAKATCALPAMLGGTSARSSTRVPLAWLACFSTRRSLPSRWGPFRSWLARPGISNAGTGTSIRSLPATLAKACPSFCSRSTGKFRRREGQLVRWGAALPCIVGLSLLGRFACSGAWTRACTRGLRSRSSAGHLCRRHAREAWLRRARVQTIRPGIRLSVRCGTSAESADSRARRAGRCSSISVDASPTLSPGLRAVAVAGTLTAAACSRCSARLPTRQIRHEHR